MKGKKGFQKGAKKPPTSGMKPGHKTPQTQEKEAHEAAARGVIQQAAVDMTQAQIQHAKGVSYMKLRLPDGSFANAKDEKQIDAAIASGAMSFQIFTQAPHTPAYMELMNRAFGKTRDGLDVTIKEDLSDVGDDDLLQRILALTAKGRA